MQRVAEAAPELVDELAEVGGRFTHHSSIAPTGTISLSLANNASNGIEPSFAHQYSRNVIREGKKSKEKVDVFSFELLAYRTLVNPEAMPHASDEASRLPDYFIAADDITPKAHVDIQAASQKWIDSSISKTANVPTDYPYEDFKDIYMYAHKQGLKGCTTFRFNPAAFQGVLAKYKNLRFVHGHLGGMVPYFVRRLQDSYKGYGKEWGVELDESPDVTYKTRVYPDTTSFYLPAMKCCLEWVGPKQMGVGTDYAHRVGDPEGAIAAVKDLGQQAGLSQEDVDCILGKNMEKLFKLPPLSK
jgi:hypothetical protein